MDVAAQISGRAFGNTLGAPVDGASVLAWDIGWPPSKDIIDASFLGTYPGAATATCKPDGTFTIHGLKPHASYAIAAASEGWLSAERLEVTAPAWDALVEMMPLYVSAFVIVHADGTPAQTNQQPKSICIKTPSRDVHPIDTASLLPYRQALPAQFRERLETENIIARYFVSPAKIEQIGPCTFETRLFAIGTVRGEEHYAHRAQGTIPTSSLVIPYGKGFGSIRLRFDHEFVESHRLGDPDLRRLGFQLLDTGTHLVGKERIAIGGLDANNEHTIENIPAGYYSLGYLGPTQLDPILAEDHSGKKWVWIEAGKTTELQFSPIDFGRIRLRIEGPECEGDFKVSVRSIQELMTCCGPRQVPYNSQGPIPLLPKGNYSIEVSWRPKGQPCYMSLGEQDFCVAPGLTTETVFIR
jgi:hypothetical protein